MITRLIKIIFFITTIFFFYSAESRCQSQDSVKQVVDSVISEDKIRLYIEHIIIEGNNVTQPEIILREMETKEKEYTSVEILKRDYERIYNLGLFTKVEFTPLPSSDKGYSLLITVHETFYILPIPIGGIKDGDIKKIWIGMNLKWRNFRGRNETLGFSFGVFYDPFVRLNYSIPWIGKTHHFFTSFDVGYSVNNNKSIDNVNSPGTPLDIDSAKSYKTFNRDGRVSVGKYIFKELSNSVSLGSIAYLHRITLRIKRFPQAVQIITYHWGTTLIMIHGTPTNIHWQAHQYLRVILNTVSEKL